MDNDSADQTILCRLDQIAEPGSKGFSFGAGGDRREIFEAGVHGYENICPHKDMILDGVPDQFLTLDKKHILCINHGARFRLHDGVCIHGPCKGQRLAPLAVEIVDGEVVLAT
jgi:nitrite reductase/ring-hydroxylating ferredoxin subunit